MFQQQSPQSRENRTPSIVALVLAYCLMCFATPVKTDAQSDGNTSVRALAEGFIAAYQRKDLDGLITLWSNKSPGIEAGKQALQPALTAGDNDAAGLAVGKVAVDGDKATVRLVTLPKKVAGTTSKSQDNPAALSHNLHCVNEHGRWKVWSYVPAEQDLAAELLAASSDKERAKLLAENSDLVSSALPMALSARGNDFLNLGDYENAHRAFRAAFDVAEQIGDKTGIVRALGGEAFTYMNQGDYAAALESGNRALRLAIETGDDAQVASAHNRLGAIFGNLENDAEAMKQFKSALAIYEKLEDKSGLATSSNGIGLIWESQGDYVKAREYLERAKAFWTELGKKSNLAKSLNNLGLLEDSLGNYRESLEYYKQSLAIKRELGEKGSMSSTVMNIGIEYVRLGDMVNALDYYLQARSLADTLGEKQNLALLLGNIGDLYFGQGNYEQAMKHYRACIELQSKIGNKVGTARMLTNIGNVYATLGSRADNREGARQALDYYYQSLQMMRELGYKEGISAALNDIAMVQSGLGRYDLAKEALDECLKIKRELGNQTEIARGIANLANLYLDQHEYVQALRAAEDAAAIVGERDTLGVFSQARTTAGRAHAALGQWDQAGRAFREAIDTIESALGGIVGGEEDRQRFFEDYATPYAGMVETLIRQQLPKDALHYAERAKGRVLVEVLRGGKVDSTNAMTAEERERERQLQAKIVSLNTQSLAGHQAGGDVASLDDEIRKTRLEYESFETGLRAAHPELRVQRGEVQPLPLKEAAVLISDTRTALLEFVVAQETTHLFVLTGTSEPGATPELKVFAINVTKKELAGRVQSFRQKLADRRAAFQSEARQLYKMILGPAMDALRSKTNLVIVPDGALWELPFQALQPTPNHFLIENVSISYAPSLTVLREMMRLRQRRNETKDWSPVILALGNPDIGQPTRNRVKGVLMDEELGPLPDAERQVRVLGRLYGPARSEIYVGSDAREDMVKKVAAKFRIIHLATHATANDASPMYSHLVLSRNPADESEDGLLEAWEITKLNLNADLVVLSACDTARGQIASGEGMIGLAWAFFVAGCPTTVVSQWKVESASTSNLMIEFHRNLLTPKPPVARQPGTAEALRRSALRLLRTSRYKHPFYWAPFVVVGDGG